MASADRASVDATGSQIRVLLVDDQRLTREGFRTLLDLEPGLVVVGEPSNGQEAVHRYAL